MDLRSRFVVGNVHVAQVAWMMLLGVVLGALAEVFGGLLFLALSAVALLAFSWWQRANLNWGGRGG